MKLQLLSKSLFVIIFASLSVFSLNAQTKAAPVGKAKPEATERRQQHDDKIAKDLNLTPEQRAHFKKTDDEFKTKRQADKTARKEESSKMRAERIKAHKSVLTPEQAAKYDEMQTKKKAKHEGKMKKKAHHKTAKKQQKAEKKAIRKELEKQ